MNKPESCKKNDSTINHCGKCGKIFKKNEMVYSSCQGEFICVNCYKDQFSFMYQRIKPVDIKSSWKNK